MPVPIPSVELLDAACVTNSFQLCFHIPRLDVKIGFYSISMLVIRIQCVYLFSGSRKPKCTKDEYGKMVTRKNLSERFGMHQFQVPSDHEHLVLQLHVNSQDEFTNILLNSVRDGQSGFHSLYEDMRNVLASV
jgi:hypothetical protein